MTKTSFKEIIRAMGLVFGDIGTSPIYTFTVIFLTTKINFENVIGVLSLIIWTLLLVVTVQYAWFAMSLSKRGEGGSIVLNEIIKSLLKTSRPVMFFTFLTFIAVSLLIGDSVITPAISMLSAVEGMRLINIFSSISTPAIMAITISITILLFFIQKHGTENISKVFGPVMFIWFCALGAFGLFSFLHMPSVILAFNPLMGIKFLTSHGLAGFFVLSEVILCATGAEALYADMGHLGRNPIMKAWYIVLGALLLNYLGQGAFILTHHHLHNVLYSMVLGNGKYFYIPFLILSILATIIASQAMISGLFSIVYQAINTRILPLFRVCYTSESINSQIYIPFANWFLMFFVIMVVLIFKDSSKLAGAYGLAVTGTMTITGIMITSIFFIRKHYIKSLIAFFILIIDFIFFAAACSKFIHGAYITLVIASMPLFIILLYTLGNKKLYNSMAMIDKNDFLEKYNKIYPNICKIKGTAIFFARGINKVPPYIIQTMFTNNIFYTDNIIINISKTSEALGISHKIEEITDGLKMLKIRIGYMEHFRLEKFLKEINIKAKVIFYGVEEIETSNVFWRIFALIKKITPTFVNFYCLPLHKIHGVINRIYLK